MNENIHLYEANGSNLENSKVVFLPLGSIEFHGLHAPTGTDSIIATKIADEVAIRVGGIVLPTVTYGYSALHEDFPGTITLQASTLTNLLFDILVSLANQNVKRVFIVNGHDGNIPSMTIASLDVRRKYPEMMIVATTWWELTRNETEVKDLFGEYGGKGHGGAEETAIVMSAGIGEVDLSKAEHAEMILHKSVGNPAPFLRNDLAIIFRDVTEITGKGFEGHPDEATKEKGDVIVNIVVNKIVAFINELESNDWKLKESL